jgi:hypothetical protein
MLTDRLITSELHVEGPTPARYWGDQWLRVSEKLLKGLNHELSNRVASLDATVGLFEPDQTIDAEFVKAVSGDVARLHGLLNLYRSLTSEALTTPEPTRLQDVVPLALRLHEHHPDLHVIQCSASGRPDTEPVLVRQAAFMRCLLVLLASAAGNTLRSGAPRAMTLTYGPDAHDVVLRFEGAAPRDQLLFSGEGSLLHAVRSALAHASGSVEGTIHRGSEPARLVYELRLPDLVTASRKDDANDRVG